LPYIVLHPAADGKCHPQRDRICRAGVARDTWIARTADSWFAVVPLPAPIRRSAPRYAALDPARCGWRRNPFGAAVVAGGTLRQEKWRGTLGLRALAK
jgi:hypothetical protein